MATEQETGVRYLLRKRGGSRVDLDQAARGRFRWAGEYWQRCGGQWGWGPSETAHRFTAAERVQAVADSSVPQVSAEWVTVYVEVKA